jgi:hypothetical protein
MPPRKAKKAAPKPVKEEVKEEVVVHEADDGFDFAEPVILVFLFFCGS